MANKPTASWQSLGLLFSWAFLGACQTIDRPQLENWQRPPWTQNQTQATPSFSFPTTNRSREVSSLAPVPATSTPSSLWQHKASVDVKQVVFAEIIRQLAQNYQFDYRIVENSTQLITYQAKQTPLKQVVEDISQQAGFIYVIDQRHIHFKRDRPFWHNYTLAYPNVARTSRSQATLNQQVEGSDQSNLEINTLIDNQFWQRFGEASEQIAELHQAKIIVNQEASIVSVYGKQGVHRQLSQLIEDIDRQVGQQLFIEMAVIEVELSQQYQAGIDWSILDNSGIVNFSQQGIGNALTEAPRTVLTATGIFEGVSLNFGARIMDRFGTTRVLSSPQIRAINNQTAVLKVVDNLVYYLVGTKVIQSDSNVTTSFDTEPKSLAVGLVISLTPHIEESGDIILNIRPSISRVINYVNDPNPELAKNDVISRIPVLQLRELESVLKVRAGEVAIIGGLMQSRDNQQAAESPGSSGLQISNLSEQSNSELVIFVRASPI